MTATTVKLFNPFFTHFVMETEDGWRYHSYSYESHVMLSLFRAPANLKASRELHYYHTDKWEKELEAKHKLPRGHLRGIFDVHRTMAEAEQIATSESTRLKLVPELSALNKQNPAMKAHVNLVLVYKIGPTGHIEATVSKEVVAEIRTYCTCVMCLPVPQPVVVIPHQCRQCLSFSCNCPIHNGKGTVMKLGPPIASNHNASALQYPGGYPRLA